MGDAERVRVERLLRSGFNAGDVTYLFLYVRDPPIRAQGRETVIDIGGFIAHSGEREKGITTAAANHFTQIARFQVLRISGGHRLGWDDMPEDFALFVDAMSYRIDSVILKNKTGLNLLKARKVAVAGLRKFKKRSNGRFRLSGNLEPIEQQVLECYVSSIVPVIAFTDEELF